MQQLRSPGFFLRIFAGALGMGSATLASAQPWLEPLIRVEGSSYELYAPRQEDIDQARRYLDLAQRAFARHFGSAPPKIAVALLDANPRGGYDDSAFRARNIPLLTWLTDRGWDAQHHGSNSSSGRRTHSEGRILPHEACHQFLRAYVDMQQGRAGIIGGRARTQVSHYGHPSVPDWFDEAAAGLCEDREEQASRRLRLRAGLVNRIPLAELFTMAHPLSGPLQIRAPAPAAPGSGASAPASPAVPPVAPGTRVGAMTFANNLSAEALERTRMFYAQSQSVAQFIAERAGPSGLRSIADGFARGRPLPDLLAELGLPRDPAILERQWLEWLPSQRQSAPVAHE